MVKGKRQKDKQYNGQRKTTKGQIIKWSKENDKRTNNIMAKGKRQKDKQYKGQRKTIKGQTI
jgi:hypothetical protein